MSDRAGDWMQVYSGGKFWPLDPRPEETHIEDIAHALAHLCRFGGHCRVFYSVAEHSVRSSLCVPAAHAFAALLHDAAEAYVVDVPRPLKVQLRGYAEIERRVMSAIAKRFRLPGRNCECPGDWPAAHHHPHCPKASNLSWVIPSCVKLADEIMLATEARDLMGGESAGKWALRAEPLPERIAPWSPEEAKARFLGRFAELGGA